MNELIIELFKYFARFVPKKALEEIFIQPTSSRKTGYDQIKTEILSLPDDNVIVDIEKFVVSANENFVSDKIKNAQGVILFIEYGRVDVDHHIIKGIRESLAVTVACDFSTKNHDNLNEILLMNRCLEILDRIIRRMGVDQQDLDFCAEAELISEPVEIHIVEPASFYGFGGWCAMFQNAKTDLI